MLSSLAYSLAKSGRKVLIFERDLTPPDRIVGELLQPGGCMRLQRLGLQHCLDNIDSFDVQGYRVFWGSQSVDIPYPERETEMHWFEDEKRSPERLQKLEETNRLDKRQEGRSFHHGRFVDSLRRAAIAQDNVTMIEGAVNELLTCASTGRTLGVRATPRPGQTNAGDKRTAETFDYFAPLTFIADGCFSKFRRQLLPEALQPVVRSNFVGLILEHADMPSPGHGHVILRKGGNLRADERGVGPVLVYQLSKDETRMLVDVPGAKPPSMANGELKEYLRKHVTPSLPLQLLPSFNAALESQVPSHRLRSMPCSYLPPKSQGTQAEGAIIAGDAMNMRHPLTGGGMTVALNDVCILTELLGGGKRVGEIETGIDGLQVIDLSEWDHIRKALKTWHWKRKGVASVINVLAQALYSLFSADDASLEVLKTGCFKYFELGGERLMGPVVLLAAIAPSPMLLVYHFFSVAFYSIYVLFTQPRSLTKGIDNAASISEPGLLQYPMLAVRSVMVFAVACRVLLPYMFSEAILVYLHRKTHDIAKYCTNRRSLTGSDCSYICSK
ncbi:hypothetical protein E5Q_02325 [Mixia osmundae IAM 14324]|uniref:Squalene monooxygenase n=1 Tax=Mixia osmundae (strain CBS 9802 / IAM 14324 / JCM 22182 / KY 12970) TaxID=764103 RepID=G7DYK8_MIXOS|nr:hypothetical protein E5Q_02325 [Mixia osmundae IAM 14324]